MLAFSIGKRYRGKTTAAYFFVKRLPVRIVFDPRYDFSLDDATTILSSKMLASDVEKVFQDGGTLVIRPDGDIDDNLQKLCDRLRGFADRRFQFGLVLDEVRLYKNALGASGTAFDDLVRHKSRNLVIVLTSHRITDVHPDLRAIGDLWCIFQTTHQGDLKIFLDQFGDPALIEKIKTLKHREFLSWDDGEGRFRIHTKSDEWKIQGLRTQTLDIGEPLQFLPSSTPRDRANLFDDEEDEDVDLLAKGTVDL